MIRKERETNVVTTQEIKQGKKQELANRKGQKLLVNFSCFFSAVALIAVQLRGSFLCLIFVHRSNEIYFIEIVICLLEVGKRGKGKYEQRTKIT